MEDLMTSNIFQNLSYLPFEEGLKKIIDNAVDRNQHKSTEIIGEVRDIVFSFWPQLPNCEPDVLININSKSKPLVNILIEAKLDSGLSGDDQLDKEWNDLETTYPGERNMMIFLTKDPMIPVAQMAEDIPEIFWINYQTIYNIFSDALKTSETENLILQDIVALMQHYNFSPFTNWSEFIEVLPYFPMFKNYFSWTPLTELDKYIRLWN